MAKAFYGFKRVSLFFSQSPAHNYIFRALALLLLLPQTSFHNQCPKVEALPIGLHLVNHSITNHVSLPSESNSSLNESSSTSPNVTNVIHKVFVSSSNDHVVNLTDSRPISIIDKHPLFIHLSEHYNEFDGSTTKNINSKVSFALEIVIRVSIFIYCCLVIGYLCDEYFVPSLENIGEALNLSADLIGAILIPFGTSGPEIFSSAVGVFFAENDIGTGAIIGSGVFNILAIPAASGLAAAYFIGDSIRLEKGPVLRDLTFYFISIIVLILAIKDNTVDFIDSSLFTILFVVYIGVMFYCASQKEYESTNDTRKLVEQNGQTANNNNNHNNNHQNNHQQLPIANYQSYQGYHLPKITINNCNGNNNSKLESNNSGGKNKIMKEYLNKCNEIMINEKQPFLHKVAKFYDMDYNNPILKEYLLKDNCNEKEMEQKFYIFIEDIINKQNVILESKHKAEYEKLDGIDDNGVGFTDNLIFRILLMPFIFVYSISMPTRFPVVTFFFSIVWLSLLSYVTVWSISGLSDLIGIPSTVSGMTILAAGSAVPDLVTSIIVIKKTGQASMGICAAIASNIFAILLGLGLPWAIQSTLNWIKRGSYTLSLITLQSSALPYTSILLLIIVTLLYFVLRFCDWKVSKQFSLICFLLHIVFVASSIFLELLIQ